MTIAIRDQAPNSIMLVRFDAIASCLEPEAEVYSWRIPIIDGMLPAGDGSYTLDEAYAEANASLISPISWQDLRRWTSRFFQIYDCEFQAVGATVRNDLKICCIDSAQWAITTEIDDVIKRSRRHSNSQWRFKAYNVAAGAAEPAPRDPRIATHRLAKTLGANRVRSVAARSPRLMFSVAFGRRLL